MAHVSGNESKIIDAVLAKVEDELNELPIIANENTRRVVDELRRQVVELRNSLKSC
jgi:hypothetical protein